jgi:hypothetical protein
VLLLPVPLLGVLHASCGLARLQRLMTCCHPTASKQRTVYAAATLGVASVPAAAENGRDTASAAVKRQLNTILAVVNA